MEQKLVKSQCSKSRQIHTVYDVFFDGSCSLINFFFTFVGCVNRYLSKEDVAQASLTKAQQEGGSIQLVTKEKQRSFTSALTPPAVHR